MERAAGRVALAANDPIAVARELSAARDQIKAAFGIVRYLTEKLGGGPITIPREEFTRGSENGKGLRSSVDGDGNAVVEVR
jgi:hypothetical protein